MPRVYERKSLRNSWTSKAMAAALSAVRSKDISIREAASQFSVPKTTLQRRLKNTNKFAKEDSQHLGRFQATLPPQIEKELVRYIILMEERLFGVGPLEARKLAFQIAKRNNIPHRFKNSIAGKDWLEGFRKRNPEISLRTPEATSAARARGFNRPAVEKFFNILEPLAKEHQYPANNIYNVDETGLSTVPGRPSRILALKGRRQVGMLTSAERGQLVTVELCMSATGNFVPPMFIFPRVRMKPELMDGAPGGTIYRCHKSGWMQMDIFTEWLEHFIKVSGSSKNNKVLLILDGHKTHTCNLDAINLARENGVDMLCLPPHCSHKMQPLDVAFMKPLSTYFIQASERWLRSHPGRSITTFQVAALFKEAYLKSATAQTAESAFRKTGIYPINRNVFNDHDFSPADVTDQPPPSPAQSGIQTSTASVICADAGDANSFASSAEACTGPIFVYDDLPSTSMYVGPLDISPLPKAPPRCPDDGKKRRTGSAVLLTGSPYKNDLAEKKLVTTGSVGAKISSKKTKKSHKSKKTQDIGSATNGDWLCIYCAEAFTNTSGEGWIQCTECKGWAHDACAGVGEEDSSFICELCQ